MDSGGIINDVGDTNLRKEVYSCQQLLVDSELEQARHKFVNCEIENLNTALVDENLDLLFNNLKYTAKMNRSLDSFFEKVEYGMIRCFYAHENDTLLDQCAPTLLVKAKTFHQRN